jgi:2-keto-3-deoxy-galactonokinase
MTGEFFELLCAKSILSVGIQKTTDLNNEKNKNAFEAGVKKVYIQIFCTVLLR